MKMMKTLSIVATGLLVVAGCARTTTTGTGVKITSGPDSAKAETVVKKLTLTANKSQTIQRSQEDKITVSINRDNFNDPVTIKFENLPKGVTFVDKQMVIASGSSSATFTMKAAAEAALGEHQVTISAEAPGLPKNQQTFKLTIKDKS